MRSFVSTKSSTAKSFPVALVLLFHNSIVAVVAVAINEYTTCLQPNSGNGANVLPETNVAVPPAICTPISACDVGPVTKLETDLIQ